MCQNRYETETDRQDGMTNILFHYAADRMLTLEEAKAKLHEDAYSRTAGETIARFCGVDKNDTAALRKRVTGLLLDSDPSARKDGVERKVRSWINGRAVSISRESAMKLIFALHLPVEQAEDMLCLLTGEGFHWREPEDIIWWFALEHGMNYGEAAALSSRMEPVSKLSKTSADDKNTMTESVRQLAEQIQTEEELEAFLREYAPHLGTLHNTAYNLYMSFMELLQSEEREYTMPEDREMPVSELVTTYLYNNLIPRAKRASEGKKKINPVLKDAIQRDIQQNWPDEFALARMTNRKTDVTRKVLILLFLACDGGETEYGDFSDDSSEDIFEDTYARLETMLSDCGFQKLDSRNPFDWMVLYSIAADDVFDIDENITAFLSEIFNHPGDDDQQGS